MTWTISHSIQKLRNSESISRLFLNSSSRPVSHYVVFLFIRTLYVLCVGIYKHKYIDIYVFLFASGQNVAHGTQLTMPLRANRWLNKLTIVENWMKESTIRVYDDDCVVDIAPPLSHFFSPPIPPFPPPCSPPYPLKSIARLLPWHGMAYERPEPGPKSLSRIAH